MQIEYLLNILFSPETMLWLTIGCIVGAILGALPGMSADTGIAIFLPITYNLSPVTGLVCLAAIYVTGSYGGNITAVLLNTPGTSDSYFMTIDGYPMTKKGQGMKAVSITTISAFVGGIIGGFSLLLIAPSLALLAVRFGPLELFLTSLMGIMVIVSMSKGNMIKGTVAAALGFLCALIGPDAIHGVPRFTMGVHRVYDGLPLLAVVLGLFAVSQLFTLIENLEVEESISDDAFKGGTLALLKTIPQHIKLVVCDIVSGIIGTFIGIIPAAGTTVAAGISYNLFKNTDKNPEQYGNGSEKGLASVSAANNGVVGGSLVPLITLGIPGNATSALFLGGLLVNGLQPGLQLFTGSPDTAYGLIWGLIFANISILIIGLFGAPLYGKITKLPKQILIPIIGSLCMLGAYSFRSAIFDMGLIIAFGVIGWYMIKSGIPIAPFVLAFVLGNNTEMQLRRSYLLYGDSIVSQFMQPIPMVLIALNLVLVLSPFIPDWVRRIRNKARTN